MTAAEPSITSTMRPPPRHKMSWFRYCLPMKTAWCWSGKNRSLRPSRWWTTPSIVKASGWAWRVKIKTIFPRQSPILITSISGSPATAGSRKSICAASRPPTCSRIRSMPLRCARSTPMARNLRTARWLKRKPAKRRTSSKPAHSARRVTAPR